MNRLVVGCVLSLVCSGSFNVVRAQTPTPSSEKSTTAPRASAGSEKSSIPPKSERSNTDAKKYYKQGVRYGRAKMFQEAAANFMQAIRLNPKYTDAYYGLGHAFLDMGRFTEAIEAFQQVIKLDPKDEEAYSRLGEAHAKLASQAAAEKPVGERVGATALSDSATAGTRTVPTVTTYDNDNIRTYRVGVGDVLDVRIQNAPPEQSTLFTVSPAGLLEHPILPRPLKVAGKT